MVSTTGCIDDVDLFETLNEGGHVPTLGIAVPQLTLLVTTCGVNVGTGVKLVWDYVVYLKYLKEWGSLLTK